MRDQERPQTDSTLSDYVIGYKDKTGKPYIAEYLEVSWIYNGENKADMDTVDDWINLEIDRQNLKATKKTYAALFNDIAKKLGIHKYAESTEKIKKVSTLLREAVEKQKYYKKLGLDLQSLEELLGK